MADPGSLLFQGLANAGQGYAQGVQNMQQYQQADAAATGQINAYLSQGPQAVANLTPDGQALAQKMIEGNANRKDKLQLLGEMQSQQSIKQQQADLAAKTAQTSAENAATNAATAVLPYAAPKAKSEADAADAQNQLTQLQLRQAKAQQDWINSLPQNGGPVGQNVTGSAQPGQAAPAGPADSLQGFITNYARVTHAMPPADVISRYLQNQSTLEQPLGVISGGTFPDATAGTTDRYFRVYKNGMGGTRVDDSPIDVPYNSKAPGTLLDASSFQPVRQALVNKMFSPNPVDVAQTGQAPAPLGPPDAQVRLGTKQQQDAIKQANDDLNTAMGTAQMATRQDQVAQNYAAKQPLHGALSFMLGTPMGLRLQQATGDNTGGALLKANAAAMGPMIQAMAGSGRVTNAEVSQLQQSQALPTDANETLLDSTDLNVQKAQALVKRQAAYKTRLVQGWAPGDASTKSQTDEPLPEFVPKSVRTAAAAKAAAPKTPAEGATTTSPSAPPVVPTVKSPADFAALPSGAVYKTPSGQFRTKP